MNNTTVNATTPSPLAPAPQTCSQSEPVNREVQVVLYSLLIIISVVGNALVIFVVIKNKRMHTVANYLICNMSTADLLITFLPLIWEVIKLMHYPDGVWPMGRFMCTFVHMAIYLSVACSILSLLVITWDRFFAIIFPFKQIFTKKILPFLLIAIWLASFGFASPTIYAMDLYDYNGQMYCVEMWKPPFDANKSPMHYTVILFVGLYAIPLLTMAVMYSIMAWKLWKRIIPGNRSSEMEKQSLKQKKKVIRMLVIVVLAFGICWLPVFIVQFMVFVDPYYKVCSVSIPKSFIFFAFFMQYLGSAINPYIYFTCSDAYRHGLKKAVRGGRVSPQVTVTSRAMTLNKKSTSTTPSTGQEMASIVKKSKTEKIIEEGPTTKESEKVHDENENI